jgi:hypothetical protein
MHGPRGGPQCSLACKYILAGISTFFLVISLAFLFPAPTVSSIASKRICEPTSHVDCVNLSSSKRIRVALVFSGQARVFSPIIFHLYQSVLLQLYDVDVFAHFWFAQTLETSVWTGQGTLNVPSTLIDDFNSSFAPHTLRVDPPLPPSAYSTRQYVHTTAQATPRNVFSAYTSMKFAQQLVEESGNFCKSRRTLLSWCARVYTPFRSPFFYPPQQTIL